DSQLVVLGGGDKDSVTVTPIGDEVDGFTGVRIVSVLNGVEGDGEYFGFFGFFPAFFYMGDGDDNVQLAPTLIFRTLIDLGEGNNTLVSGAGDDEVTAGAGNDRIDTGTEFDHVNAGDGNNTVDIEFGSVTTGSGNDTVHIVSGSVTTGAGNDVVRGG